MAHRISQYGLVDGDGRYTGPKAGSTACVVLIRDSTLAVASAGDSRWVRIWGGGRRLSGTRRCSTHPVRRQQGHMHPSMGKGRFRFGCMNAGMVDYYPAPAATPLSAARLTAWPCRAAMHSSWLVMQGARGYQLAFCHCMCLHETHGECCLQKTTCHAAPGWYPEGTGGVRLRRHQGGKQV